MNFRKAITSMIALLGMAAFVVPAHAQYVTLSPGGQTVTLNAVASLQGLQNTTALASIIGETIAAAPGESVPTGSFTENVYQQSNGGLTFTYQLTQTSTSLDPTTHQDLGGFYSLITSRFGGYSTASAYLSNTGNISAPFTAQRSSGAGNNITFGFQTLALNNSTPVLIVSTNASSFQSVSEIAQNGGLHQFGGLGPSGPVAPEPASFAVFGFIGLGLLSLMVRARRGNAQLAA